MVNLTLCTMRHLLAHLGESFRSGCSFADVNIRTASGGRRQRRSSALRCHALVLAAASPALMASVLHEAAREEGDGVVEVLLAGVDEEEARRAVAMVYEGVPGGAEDSMTPGVAECLHLMGIKGCAEGRCVSGTQLQSINY